MKLKIESATNWNWHKRQGTQARKPKSASEKLSVRFAYIKTEIDNINPKVRIWHT